MLESRYTIDSRPKAYRLCCLALSCRIAAAQPVADGAELKLALADAELVFEETGGVVAAETEPFGYNSPDEH